MGMFTEIVISTTIKDDPIAVAILKYMTRKEEIPEPVNLPNHPLFEEGSRWNIMLLCSSYYHVPRTLNLFEFDEISKEWCLISRSDFKNYGNEAALFFDWINQYSTRMEGQMIGYSLYEENNEPTIYFKKPE